MLDIRLLASIRCRLATANAGLRVHYDRQPRTPSPVTAPPPITPPKPLADDETRATAIAPAAHPTAADTAPPTADVAE